MRTGGKDTLSASTTRLDGFVVCDASTVVAALVDAGPDGVWATKKLDDVALAAPALLDFEAANVLRRLELRGDISAEQAAQAHVELVALDIEKWPYEALAMRVWDLRANLTCYDASYVAVAEVLEAPLATLDTRIAGAPGLRCDVMTP